MKGALALFLALGSLAAAQGPSPFGPLPPGVAPSGPPPQGIPALGFGGSPKVGVPASPPPTFERPDRAARWLGPEEPVLVYKDRAYPLLILIWHEIVNDVVAGEPVLISYCPLCNSGLAFSRRLPGRGTLSFGTSGLLYRSNLVMFDDRTASLWSQLEGEAIVGPLKGARLSPLPLSLLPFGAFRARFPQGRVLSRETGYARPYGENPYAGYDRPEEKPFLFSGPLDPRLPPKARVVAVRLEGKAVAYPYRLLQQVRVVNDGPLVVFWAPGLKSALEAKSTRLGRDVGAVGVFLREGRIFFWDGRAFRDRKTGSVWDLFGRAVAGPLKGKALTPVVHDRTFWFAWAAFLPGTRVYPCK